MKRTFSGAYCARCEEWKRTSVPVPSQLGVHHCAECAAVIESAIGTLPGKAEAS